MHFCIEHIMMLLSHILSMNTSEKVESKNSLFSALYLYQSLQCPTDAHANQIQGRVP
uniref:Uncharacterized protein n=1 Tax=Arundo donax TaxID=35708 RepID=A0A0A9BRB4_ARUDO